MDFIMIAYAAETAHTATESAQGIGALGIEWRSLLFQLINFAILLFLLQKYAFPSIIRVLEIRREKIEESLRMAEAIEAKQKEIQAMQTTILEEAQEQSNQLIAASKQQAETVLKENEKKAKERSEKIMEEAREMIEQEAIHIKKQLKTETLELVVKATEKIVGEKLNEEKDLKFIESTLRSLETKEFK